MLTISKIHSQSSQGRGESAAGYLSYLGKLPTRERGFEAYARGDESGPAPLWAGKGAALLGLGAVAEAEQVERLARGLHPITGAALVKGAGKSHVMGLDMTFSAPKDFSAIFAGADDATREELQGALIDAARAALAYAEASTVTRHGKAGGVKQRAEAAVATLFQHFSSRAGDPQNHVHALVYNVAKRTGVDEWSAVEAKAQFDRKLATGILFRAELASRLVALGFGVEPAGPYFTIRGVTDAQREALSTRTREIDQRLREAGVDLGDGAARRAAAGSTRAAKAEPPLPQMLAGFKARAAELGITPESVSVMRSRAPELAREPFAIDREELLAELTSTQSCATSQEALALICRKAMGRWSAEQCSSELASFMEHAEVVRLGRSELLEEVFTSKATLELEREISDRVEAGKRDLSHRVPTSAVDREFDALERELRAKLGVEVSLAQQRAAAAHLVSETGNCAFVEGWAGAGKTTMLSAAARAWKSAGFEVAGCCQSAAAAQNLARESCIPSRTVASLLLAVREGRSKLAPNVVLVLDECGMVGSREFGLLQEAALSAGAKLCCVGDPKQLQPIEAGGICAALAREHGKAEISNIQRQRTDFEPLLAWLTARAKPGAVLDKAKAAALRALPEDSQIPALEALGAQDAKLGRAFARWRSRYDFQWMRDAVRLFAQGEARPALNMLDAKGRLKLAPTRDAAFDELISAWAADKTPVERKLIVAATRSEVAELNARARAALVETGAIDDARGVDVEIRRRDGSTDARRFAPGDRIVFTMNDRELGVANGVSGTVADIGRSGSDAELLVELDDANPRGHRAIRVPASFAMFDNALCSTAHRAQGRTLDSAHVLANPSMSDREWTYVAASRSRFATTIYVDASALGLVDAEAHRDGDDAPKGREAAIDALASRMRRSRAKGTTLDFDAADIGKVSAEPKRLDHDAIGLADISLALAKRFISRISGRDRKQHQTLGR